VTAPLQHFVASLAPIARFIGQPQTRPAWDQSAKGIAAALPTGSHLDQGSVASLLEDVTSSLGARNGMASDNNLSIISEDRLHAADEIRIRHQHVTLRV